MYLYFDRNGALKEIINDSALRQGNYDINRIYVYVEGRDGTRGDVHYLLSDGTNVGPILADDFSDDSGMAESESYVPLDPRRNLKYFRYNTPYRFLIIDLSEQDEHGHSALDVSGVAHCSIDYVLEGGAQLALGDVNFCVQLNPHYAQREVAAQEYLSLADYLYLKKLIDTMVEITGEDGLNIHGTKAGELFHQLDLMVSNPFALCKNLTTPLGDQSGLPGWHAYYDSKGYWFLEVDGEDPDDEQLYDYLLYMTGTPYIRTEGQGCQHLAMDENGVVYAFRTVGRELRAYEVAKIATKAYADGTFAAKAQVWSAYPAID